MKLLATIAALVCGFFALTSAALADTSGAVTPGNAASQSDLSGCVYRSGSITAANGQQMAIGCDAAGGLNISALNLAPAYQNSSTYSSTSTTYYDYPLGCQATSSTPSLTSGKVYGCFMDLSGNIFTASEAAAGSSETSRSGTISVGGTAQQVMAANTARTEAFFFNASSTEACWINYVGGTATVATAGSIYIPPYGGWSGGVTNAVSAVCATGGHVFTAGER